MKYACSVLFAIFGFVLSAGNLELTASMYLAPASESNKNVNATLKNPQTQRLFIAKIIGFSGTTSGCTLINHFGFQKAGFSFKATPGTVQKGKKTTKINTNIDWTLLEAGPFKASEKESFYEGTVVNCTRRLLPGTFSPLGINLARDAKVIYISREAANGKSLLKSQNPGKHPGSSGPFQPITADASPGQIQPESNAECTTIRESRS